MPPARAAAESRFLQAGERLAAGDLAAAEAGYREALRLDPTLAEAHANLAYVLERRGESAEAEANYRRAIAAAPDDARVHLNYATLLAAQARFDEAEAAYGEALRLDPAVPAAWSNLGALYAGLGRCDEAEACHRRALEIDPGYPPARFNLGYVLLRRGRFGEGWRCLEARSWPAMLEARLPMPRWRGEAIAGRRLLIGCEAGHGDMIQFCRYAAELKRLGARRVGALCHPGLVRLFGSLAGVDTVCGLDAVPAAADWDGWVPALSLPLCCATHTEADVPAALPYLHAEPALVTQWGPRLPAKGVRVGLVWKGNPRFENDAQRSLPGLATLAPLAAIPGIAFVSLQKGAGEDEALAPPAGMSLVPLGTELGDFADTAAAVAGLDLVIAVDTGVAHLAAALGKPCWILLPAYKTDWRWLEARSDSPWYPGVLRLFRQQRIGDWAAVVAEVADALRAWCSPRL